MQSNETATPGRLAEPEGSGLANWNLRPSVVKAVIPGMMRFPLFYPGSRTKPRDLLTLGPVSSTIQRRAEPVAATVTWHNLKCTAVYLL